MSLKEDVIEVHLRHPSWTKDQVAAFLGISYTSVKTVARRSNLTFPPKKFMSFKRTFRRFPYAGKVEGTGEW